MKNVVITGGTSGLGLALAQKFNKEHYNVFVLSRTAEGENAIVCDVSKRDSIENAFKELSKHIETIDILINNAGLALFGATELLKPAEIENIFNVVFFGTLYTSQAALKFMKKGSKIINISSACALFALPYRSMYCASKSAVSMLSLCLRMELKNAGINVVDICPGNIKTNFSKNRVKNFDTNQRYGDSIEKAANRIDKEENNRMKLSTATNKIFDIIEKKKAKPRYIIGFKYKFLHFMSRIVPLSLILKVTNSISKSKK